MRYFKVKDVKGNGPFTCITRSDARRHGLGGFVGVNKKDDLPFGYLELIHKNGLRITMRRDLLKEVEEFDYETCVDYEKVIL